LIPRPAAAGAILGPTLIKLLAVWAIFRGAENRRERGIAALGAKSATQSMVSARSTFDHRCTAPTAEIAEAAETSERCGRSQPQPVATDYYLTPFPPFVLGRSVKFEPQVGLTDGGFACLIRAAKCLWKSFMGFPPEGVHTISH
jgi:hypothetical protein